MRKALTATGIALLVAPVAVVASYFGLQRYLDWLIAGAKRPLTGPQRPRAFASGDATPAPPDTLSPAS